MSRLASLLNVRRGEGRLVVLVGLLFAALQAGQGMGDNAASALFFLRYGVEFLPYMYVLLGGLTFVITVAYTAALGRFPRRRFYPAVLLGAAGLLILERLALPFDLPALYPILWLTVSCLGTLLLGTLSWQMAGELTDARQARRLFPLFTSAGILGGVTGNALTGRLARLLGTENLLPAFAALLVVAFVLTNAITRTHLRPVKVMAASNLPADLRAGFDFVRGSQLMRLVSGAAILLSVLFFSIAFPFSKVVSASFADEAEVAGFLGTFSSITTAVTFAVSLLLANRVFRTLGIVNSVLLLPVTYLLGFVVFSSRYDLGGGVMARFSQLVVLSAIAGTAWNALFNVVPSMRRGQVLAFTNGVPAQIGVVLSGGLLILGERMLSTAQILLLGGAVSLVAGWLIWRMRAAYAAALVEALEAGRLEVFSATAEAFQGLQGDAAALRAVNRALASPKPATRRLAAEMVGRMQASECVSPLLPLVKDEAPQVRAAAIHSLATLHARDALPSVAAALDDADGAVRLAALQALTPLEASDGEQLIDRLAALMQDASPETREQAAAALCLLGRADTAKAAVMAWLKDDLPALRIAGVRTYAMAASGDGAMPDPTPVMDAMHDQSSAVRAAAAQALTDFEDDLAREQLAAALEDAEPEVRNAAAASLRSQSPATTALVLETLQGGSATARQAALEALHPGDTLAAADLRELARRETKSLTDGRLWHASLPAQNGAVRLLRDGLGRRLRMAEAQLVRIVGLIGNPRAMELVHRHVQRPDAEGRAMALEALEVLGDPALARGIVAALDREPEPRPLSDVLRELMVDDDRWTRLLAIRSVQELNLAALTPAVAQAWDDADALVQRAAIDALCHFGEAKPMETLQTLSTIERVLLLREVPIFAGLPVEDLEQVAQSAREQWFADGSVICREGEEAQDMFIIVDGQVRIVQTSSAERHHLAKRGPGDFLGEMAIFESSPRSATVEAEGDVRLLTLDGALFKSILRERPDVSLAVLASMSRRLREMSQHSHEH